MFFLCMKMSKNMSKLEDTQPCLQLTMATFSDQDRSTRMAPKVKLTYFPLFGKGETIKLCLAAGKVIATGATGYGKPQKKKNIFLVSRALRGGWVWPLKKNNIF